MARWQIPHDALISTMWRFVVAAQEGDGAAMEALMNEDFVGYVTTADAGVRTATRADYIGAMDVATSGLRLDIPNVMAVGHDRVLAMIEVHAARNSRTLHNFSGQLATVREGRITELWMVEALPAESVAFWSASPLQNDIRCQAPDVAVTERPLSGGARRFRRAGDR